MGEGRDPQEIYKVYPSGSGGDFGGKAEKTRKIPKKTKNLQKIYY